MFSVYPLEFLPKFTKIIPKGYHISKKRETACAVPFFDFL